MAANGGAESRECQLQNYLCRKGGFAVNLEAENSTMSLSIIGSEKKFTYFDDIIMTETLFGKQWAASKYKTVRFDLITKPVPNNNAVYIVELKIGEIILKHIHQLVGYISLLRYTQKFGGEGGLGQLARILNYTISPKTKIYGLLIGKHVSNGQLLWIPPET